MINLEIKKWALAVSAVLALSACQPSGDKNSATTDSGKKAVESGEVSETSTLVEGDKMGYALGAKMAGFIKNDIEKYDLPKITNESIAKGFTDALAGKTQMTEQEVAAQFTAFQQQMQAAQQQAAEVQRQAHAAESEKAKAAGEAFLAENGKKEGVTTTESGLQYRVITAGKEGDAKPVATDTVVVHYTGTFIDGKQFDSSVERGQPATFPLNRVIKGWTEGLQLMSVGSKYHFVIPSDIAYGPNGKPGAIPGNSVLEFDVELIAINPSAEEGEKTE